jgi:hypothetical protein
MSELSGRQEVRALLAMIDRGTGRDACPRGLTSQDGLLTG